jgi:hypothetical protein
MATVNLNPSSTVSNDWGIIGGAGTAHGVLSDGASGTYIQTQAQYRACIVELDDYTAGGTISNIRFVVKGFLFNTRSGDTDIQVIIISSEEVLKLFTSKQSLLTLIRISYKHIPGLNEPHQTAQPLGQIQT